MTSSPISNLSSRLPSLEQVRTEICRRRLIEFFRDAWKIVYPGVPFSDNWHLSAIAEHLEAVTAGQIRNLLINVPPRTSKSSLVSVVWPAWVWARHPEVNWLFASHSQRISTRDSIACRLLLESQWYSSRWPVSFAADQNEKQRYTNVSRGTRIAISTNSGITGEGGDVLVVDDPHAVDDSAETIEQTREWFDTVLSTRGNDPRRVAKVIIMQRVREDDLSAHVLDQGSWEHLCLPMAFEPGRQKTTVLGWNDPRQTPGELLWPSRFGQGEVDGLKRQLGSYASAAQLQQRPSPAGGGIIKIAWWKKYDSLPAGLTDNVLSVDCTFSGKSTSDFVCMQAWARKGADRFLIDQIRGRWDYPTTRTQFKAFCDRHPLATRRLIEAKANGQALIDDLKREISGLIPIVPHESKEQRVHAVSAQIESGNVYLPANAEWVDGFIGECAAFPAGANDDQVDCCTQALAYYGRPRIEFKREIVRP